MQSVSSRIWTRVTVFISYDDNHYTTGIKPINNDCWILYNLKKGRLFHFLSLPCCCQCRFKIYIAKQTNSNTEETAPLWHQHNFSTTCQLSFLSLSMWQAKNHMIHFSFFIFFTLIFLSLKIISKNFRDLTFRSFFLSFFYFVHLFSFEFFLSLRITKKNVRDITFLSWEPKKKKKMKEKEEERKSANCYDCWLDNLSAFLKKSFDVASHKSHDSFFLCFSL